jgi:hypothetical protein
MSEAFSIVLTLRPFSHHARPECDNLRRFLDIGMVTWERFFPRASREGLRDFFVIVPKEDLAKTSKALTTAHPDWPWRVISEDSLLHASLPPGWARQQTAKLSVSFLVQTPLYLIIDDDTYLTKPFQGAADLRDPKSGKLLLNRTAIDFPFFFFWSSQVLQCDFDKVQAAPYHMAITPEIFVTSEVRELVKHLTSLYGDKKAWQLHLLQNKFTEYCLYWIWLLMNERTQSLYAAADCSRQLYDHATTGPEHDLHQRVRASFEDNANHVFSFVQSSLPYPVSTIRDAVLAQLPQE